MSDLAHFCGQNCTQNMVKHKHTQQSNISQLSYIFPAVTHFGYNHFFLEDFHGVIFSRCFLLHQNHLPKSAFSQEFEVFKVMHSLKHTSAVSKQTPARVQHKILTWLWRAGAICDGSVFDLWTAANAKNARNESVGTDVLYRANATKLGDFCGAGYVNTHTKIRNDSERP